MGGNRHATYLRLCSDVFATTHKREATKPRRLAHPVLKGPAEQKSLTALLEKRAEAVLARRLVMSVYPMQVTPFSVLYT